MWECPDLFPLADTHLLICCPQGLAREAQRFLNTYPAVWMAGRFDAERGAFDHGPLHELDSGFEFYAPQTMLAEDGRRLLVGWMGVPDGEEMHQPTRAQGWIHQMTCVRELEWQAGTLYQRPLRELAALRGEAEGWRGQTLPLAPMELAFDIAPTARWGWILPAPCSSPSTATACVCRAAGCRRRRCITATGAARRGACRSLSTAPAWRFSSTMAKG